MGKVEVKQMTRSKNEILDILVDTWEGSKLNGLKKTTIKYRDIQIDDSPSNIYGVINCKCIVVHEKFFTVLGRTFKL